MMRYVRLLLLLLALLVTDAWPAEGREAEPRPPMQVVPAEPEINVQADTSLALPGDVVVWTVEIHNPGVLAIGSVRFSHQMPSELAILAANTSAGVLSHDDREVTFHIQTMSPGQFISVYLTTRIVDDTVPFLIVNAFQLNTGAQARDRIVSEPLGMFSRIPRNLARSPSLRSRS